MKMPATLSSTRQVRSYGRTVPGPEAKLMRSLKSWAVDREREAAHWAASGLAIGAAEPDLVLVACRPSVHGLREMTPLHARVLAYLAEVDGARASAIARRSNLDPEVVEAALGDLVAVGAVTSGTRKLGLAPTWKGEVVDTVAVEAKVTDWRRGARQAARNRVFAQRSFLAVPSRTAARIESDPWLLSLGIGILAVGSTGVVVAREAPRSRPLIWFYYYWLAVFVAASLRRSSRDVRRSDR